MQYLDILIGALGAFVLAWIADQLTGRRGLFATSLVAGIGALCGWFVTVRVMGIATLDDWRWIPWSMAGSLICLVAFFLFRSKR